MTREQRIRNEKIFKVAYGFKTASIHTYHPLNMEQATELAHELLNAVNFKSLAAARREMHSNPRWSRMQVQF